MNILFLDDDERRINKVWEFLRKNKFNMENFIFTSTASVAIGKFTLGSRWDMVFLDHDLGNEIYADSSRRNTGAEVTRYLLENKWAKDAIGKIIVHSFNPSGAEVMLSNLIRAGFTPIYAPFNGAVFNSILKEICDGT